MKRKIDSFLDENDWTYTKRELARKIEEHPSSVYRALQRCIEGDDLDPPTVVLIVGMGYCHMRHEASQRKRKEQLPAFRQVIREEGATTQKEDRLALKMEKVIHHVEDRFLMGPILRFYRWLFRDSPGLQTPESMIRFFSDVAVYFSGDWEDIEKLDRSWRTLDRWRQKPE